MFDILLGTTSAYAENTQGHRRGGHRGWNYLRVRGEYEHHMAFARGGVELPPRTRRILTKLTGNNYLTGTTSAYAENTVYQTTYHENQRNYLRVRGEYSCIIGAMTMMLELPPRTRRIQSKYASTFAVDGTTSAYAENTAHAVARMGRRRNYLRVRGEYNWKR